VRDILENEEEYILARVRKSLATSKNPEKDDLVKQILNSDKIFIYGVGRSGLMAKAFAIRLVQLGLKMFFVGETVTPIVEKDDLVMIISNTGETMSAVQTANIVRREGAKVIAITAKKHTKLAHASNMVIHLNIKKDPEDAVQAPLGTVFELTAMVFLDSIVSEIMKETGQTESDMRARHAIWV
jgi:6-phospho-3-hexuloisomerase